MGRLVGKRTRLAALLFAAVVAALTIIYFHNGRCFACESNEPDPYATCAYHNGPCTVQNATVEFDECRTTYCENCDTCDNSYNFTCCYYGQYRCNDDLHFHQVIVNRECRQNCVPLTHGSGDECPQGMMCE